MKLKIEDFTNQELVNAIAIWLGSEENCEIHNCDLVDDLRSGEWLDYFKEEEDDRI